MNTQQFFIASGERRIDCLLYSGAAEPSQTVPAASALTGAAEPGQTGLVVIYGHGFAGHKETTSAATLARRLLAERSDAAVLVFDWPGHGADMDNPFSLAVCGDVLAELLDRVQKRWPAAALCGCAGSFGAYLLLKYAVENGNPFRRLALRSPAVNMYEVLTETIMGPEKLRRAMAGETVFVGFDRKIAVNRALLEELRAADAAGWDCSAWSDRILIAMGTTDEVVPEPAVRAFAARNGIEYLPVAGADHRFQDPARMALAVEAMVRWLLAP